MKRFVEGVDRDQATLFSECPEDWVEVDNPVRVIDVFADELDLGGLGVSRGSDPFRAFELKTARPNLRMLNVLWVGRRYLCSGATLASFIP
jgi:hypothetical protein